MLVNTIARFLNLSDKQANNLMDLLSLEGRWQEAQYWNGKNYQFSDSKTQADVINFLQAVGQSQWYKDLDDSKLADTNYPKALNQKYYALFEGIGITHAVTYDTAMDNPDFSVVLGCYEEDVRARVAALKQDILINNLSPKTEIIFGLGGDRKLGTVFNESTIINELKTAHFATTEMNMLNLLTETTLQAIMKQDKKFKSLVYQPINTTFSKVGKNSVTTADTAMSLKKFIETRNITKSPIHIAVYSNQPYILRQQRDIQETLGTNYHVIGLGSALTLPDFNKDRKSVNICLGEIARLININYRPENLKNFTVNLTTQEIEQAASL